MGTDNMLRGVIGKEPMNLKWGIGIASAMLTVVFTLPGLASAQEPEVNANTACDGTFAIDADYPGGDVTQREYIWIDGKSWDDSFGNGSTPPSGMQVHEEGSHYVADPNIADYYKLDDAQEDFFVLSGGYQAVQNNGGWVTVEVFQTDDVDYVGSFKSGAVVNAYDTATVTFGPDADLDPNNDWERCKVSFCLSGDPLGGYDYSFAASPSDDCYTVKREVIFSVPEPAYSQASVPDATNDQFPHLGGTIPTQEVAAVESLMPTIEVIALPAAGYGDMKDSGFGTTVQVGLLLISLGGIALLVARRQT